MPSSYSAKFLLLVGFLFGTVCFNSFAAQIVTSLTSSQGIKTFHELVRYPGFKFTQASYYTFKQEISSSKNPDMVILQQRLAEYTECSGESRKIEMKNHVNDIVVGNSPKVFVAPSFILFNPGNLGIQCQVSSLLLTMGKINYIPELRFVKYSSCLTRF